MPVASTTSGGRDFFNSTVATLVPVPGASSAAAAGCPRRRRLTFLGTRRGHDVRPRFPPFAAIVILPLSRAEFQADVICFQPGNPDLLHSWKTLSSSAFRKDDGKEEDLLVELTEGVAGFFSLFQNKWVSRWQ